jgi:hypothetical protein
LGRDPYLRTPEQAAINKEVIDAAARAKEQENTASAQNAIQFIESSFDSSGYLKSEIKTEKAQSPLSSGK